MLVPRKKTALCDNSTQYDYCQADIIIPRQRSISLKNKNMLYGDSFGRIGTRNLRISQANTIKEQLCYNIFPPIKLGHDSTPTNQRKSIGQIDGFKKFLQRKFRAKLMNMKQLNMAKRMLKARGVVRKNIIPL